MLRCSYWLIENITPHGGGPASVAIVGQDRQRVKFYPFFLQLLGLFRRSFAIDRAVLDLAVMNLAGFLGKPGTDIMRILGDVIAQFFQLVPNFAFRSRHHCDRRLWRNRRHRRRLQWRRRYRWCRRARIRSCAVADFRRQIGRHDRFFHLGRAAYRARHQAALGLLNVQGETQNPPGYMDQIVYHLNGLVNAPGAPGSVRTVTKQVLPVLGTIETWLQKLRSDDKKLLTMDDFKLGQNAALSLLDDMVLQASNVYSGTTDPATGHLDQGVAWVRQQLQSLATLSVSTYVAGQTPVPEVAPSSQPGPAFVQPLLQLWKEVEQCI